MTSLVGLLHERARRDGDRLAIVGESATLSWAELSRGVRVAAARLAAHGVIRGDRVILAASSSPAFVCGYFAVHHLGAVALPVDPRIPAERLGDIAERTSPRAIFLARAIDVGRPTSDVEELGAAGAPATGEAEAGDPVTRSPEDTADILFTSGTTGRPKGVVLSHRAIGAAARNINAFLRNGPDDREVVPLPLSHSFGLGRLRCEVLAGGTIILVDGFTAAGKLFAAMEEWRATGFSFVPAGLAILFQTTGDRLGDFAETLRWVEVGSAAMPRPHKERLMQLLPRTRLCMHYGLTEASRSAFIEFHESKATLDAIGRATPGIEIRVVDEKGTERPAGERGKIVVRGETLMTGYWEDPELTRATFLGDWLVSGDLGRRDADGTLYLEGREKDMINVGGREVSPVEIERILEELPQVLECACAGIPDPQGITGFAVKAFLVAKPGTAPVPPKALAKHLRGRVEPYKMPAAFEWIDAIPRTSNGKVQRSRLVASG
ncbi:MAG: class I adenylate-forming enzyme family protein [bacterium]